MPAILSMASAGAQLIGSAIDIADSGAEIFNARHPNAEREAEVMSAVHDARVAAGRLNSADEATMDQAKADALAAYEKLHALMNKHGIPQATAPDGGAENDQAPIPEPFELPSAAEMEARL